MSTQTTIPEKLAVRTLLEISSALSSLDGTPTSVKSEDGKSEKIILVPYKFNGKNRWNIAKNLNVLKGVSENLTKARDAVINELSNGSGKIDPADEATIKAFNEKFAEVLDAEESTKGLLAISLAGLNLDENQIPASILAALEPIVAE